MRVKRAIKYVQIVEHDVELVDTDSRGALLWSHACGAIIYDFLRVTIYSQIISRGVKTHGLIISRGVIIMAWRGKLH